MDGMNTVFVTSHLVFKLLSLPLANILEAKLKNILETNTINSKVLFKELIKIAIGTMCGRPKKT